MPKMGRTDEQRMLRTDEGVAPELMKQTFVLPLFFGSLSQAECSLLCKVKQQQQQEKT